MTPKKLTNAQLLAAADRLVDNSAQLSRRILRELIGKTVFDASDFDAWTHNLNQLVIVVCGALDVDHALTVLSPEDEVGGHHVYALGGDGESDDSLAHKFCLALQIMNNRLDEQAEQAECMCKGCGRTVRVVPALAGWIGECAECRAKVMS